MMNVHPDEARHGESENARHASMDAAYTEAFKTILQTRKAAETFLKGALTRHFVDTESFSPCVEIRKWGPYAADKFHFAFQPTANAMRQTITLIHPDGSKSHIRPNV